MNLSIIIPVYNVEEFVEQTLVSVLGQKTTLDYEVVVVNDGTPDNSMDVVNKVVARYPDSNITIINQKNQGLSMARNNGIAKAKGDWIWCVDSDDYINDKALSLIENQIRDNSLDAITFSGLSFIENEYTFDNRQNDGKVFSGIEMIESGNYTCSVPYTIYRKSVLIENNLTMVPGIYHEDTEFSPRAYYKLRKVYNIGEVFYLRRNNPDSITHKVNFKKNFDNIFVAWSLYKFQNTLKFEHRHLLKENISTVINSSCIGSTLMERELQCKLNDELKKCGPLFDEMKLSNRLRCRLEGYLFRIFYSHPLKVYQMLDRIYSLFVKRENN